MDISYLHPTFLMNDLFLPPHDYLFVINVIRDIHLDTELVSKLVDASTVCADNAANIFLVNIEFGGLE